MEKSPGASLGYVGLFVRSSIDAGLLSKLQIMLSPPPTPINYETLPISLQF